MKINFDISERDANFLVVGIVLGLIIVGILIAMTGQCK